MVESIEVVLVQKAQGGDKLAYQELIKRYSRLVWVIVYGIVKDPGWAEDLVQETFLKSWQALKTLRNPASFRGWLTIIARRLALQHNEDMLRQDKVIDNLVSNPADETSEPALEDLREQLHWALRQLPEKYRLPLTLRYQEGYDYKKISQTLNITNGSLRGLLNRGMKLLRQELGQLKQQHI